MGRTSMSSLIIAARMCSEKGKWLIAHKGRDCQKPGPSSDPYKEARELEKRNDLLGEVQHNLDASQKVVLREGFRYKGAPNSDCRPNALYATSKF
ncbi:hypothetical protein J6590_039643 [Homalodisca vitripennis]|nr:hypothetical protein J6590_039643 [Homalodisca vitripennis]